MMVTFLNLLRVRLRENLAAKFSKSFLALLDALSSGSVIVHSSVKRLEDNSEVLGVR